MQGEVAGGDQQPMQMVLRVKHPSSLSSSEEAAGEGEGSSRSALSVFKAKEEQIERKKMEVREKVFAQLGRVEEESKRLAFIRQPRHSGAAIANARAAEIFAGHHASWADAAADLRPRLADAEQQPAAQRAHADRLDREAQERDSLLSALLAATPPDLLPDSAASRLHADAAAAPSSPIPQPEPAAPPEIGSGHADGSIRLWDAETGACDATLHGHRSAASALRFASLPPASSSPPAARTATSSSGTSSCRSAIRAHRDQVTDLVF